MKRIGILGGGQLGRMFAQNALNYPAEICFLDPNPEAPCSAIGHEFIVGDFNDEQTVYDFGKNMDVISIEIEQVNVQALKKLKSEGKTIIPDPHVLEIIQDKGKQKDFYLKNNIPTAPLVNPDETKQFVQKLNQGGYDGRGVLVVKDTKDHENLFQEPSTFEALADIKKELALIGVQSPSGERRFFPLVEQVFNPELNLLDYLLSPARVNESIENQALNIGNQLLDAFNSPGIFAIEMFLNQDDTLWVNETAPRLHNSGHATIEANYSSQFDQMMRILMNLPLGDSSAHHHSLMWNLIGEKNHSGDATIDGIEICAAQAQTFLHWYGKSITQPGRKMGHITLLGHDFETLKENIQLLKEKVKVVSIG